MESEGRLGSSSRISDASLSAPRTTPGIGVHPGQVSYALPAGSASMGQAFGEAVRPVARAECCHCSSLHRGARSRCPEGWPAMAGCPGTSASPGLSRASARPVPQVDTAQADRPVATSMKRANRRNSWIAGADGPHQVQRTVLARGKREPCNTGARPYQPTSSTLHVRNLCWRLRSSGLSGKPGIAEDGAGD